MNHIVIELCAEDRARLDRILSAMERVTGPKTTASPEAPGVVEPIVDESAVVPEAGPVEAKPAKPKPAKPKPVKVEPGEDIPLEQIRKKTIELTAIEAKKPQVRAIIKEFGTKVSDLITPEQRRAAWDKLTALEAGA